MLGRKSGEAAQGLESCMTGPEIRSSSWQWLKFRESGNVHRVRQGSTDIADRLYSQQLRGFQEKTLRNWERRKLLFIESLLCLRHFLHSLSSLIVIIPS